MPTSLPAVIVGPKLASRRAQVVAEGAIWHRLHSSPVDGSPAGASAKNALTDRVAPKAVASAQGDASSVFIWTQRPMSAGRALMNCLINLCHATRVLAAGTRPCCCRGPSRLQCCCCSSATWPSPSLVSQAHHRTICAACTLLFNMEYFDLKCCMCMHVIPIQQVYACTYLLIHHFNHRAGACRAGQSGPRAARGGPVPRRQLRHPIRKAQHGNL
jgi:hypothetical protein